MKILLVHNFYRSNNIGGEDIVYRQELASLKKHLGSDNVLSYEVSNDNIKTAKLVFSIFFSFFHFISVYNFVKRNRVSIVHVHNFFPVLTPGVFLASRMAGAKVVLTLHNYRIWCISGILYRPEQGICKLCVNKSLPWSGIRYRCYRGSTLQSALAQFSFSFYRLFGMFRWVDRFFALTEFQKQEVIKLGIPETKLAVKPNFSNVDRVSPQTKSGYLFVGRLEESKGILYVLDEWKKLPKTFELTVVGGSEDLESLKVRYADSNIHFTGPLNRSEVLSAMASSKYLIQSSFWYETFGLTIVEAQSVGTPVIGFNIGTRPEFIVNGYNGFICEPKEFYQTILKSELAENYAELSENSILSAKKYSETTVIDRQVRLYREIF